MLLTRIDSELIFLQTIKGGFDDRYSKFYMIDVNTGKVNKCSYLLEKERGLSAIVHLKDRIYHIGGYDNDHSEEECPGEGHREEYISVQHS